MIKEFCVYRHRRLDNNQVFYIGISNNLRRPYDKQGRNKYWKSIVAKAGFEAEILHYCDTWEEACDTEKLLIAYYGRKDLGTGILCNMTDGGDGIIGQIITPETREKISRANKGKRVGITFSDEHRENISKAAMGRVASDEAKKKMSESRKGIALTPEQLLKKPQNLSKPVIMLPLGIMFTSATEAALVTGICEVNIRAVCNKRQITAGKFKWEFI